MTETEIVEAINALDFAQMNTINTMITVSHIAPVGATVSGVSSANLQVLAGEINALTANQVDALNGDLFGRLMAKHPC